MDLYNQYRPTSLKDVDGQPEAVTILQKNLAKDTLPKALMLTGPSGVGKTTIARILAKALGCKDDQSMTELDAAQDRGIATIREIRDSLRYTPLTASGKRVWIFDEAHRFTRDSQEALLLTLESSKDCFHFILCTTDPEKVLATVRNRCTIINLKPVSETILAVLVNKIAKAEGKTLGTVVNKIAEAADGSPRRALVLLQKIIDLDSEEEQLEFIDKAELKHQAIQLARILIDPKATWKDVAPILKSLEGEDPEQLRWMVLGYCRAIMIKSPTSHLVQLCSAVIDFFRDAWYESKHAGLVVSCYKIVSRRK